MWERCSASLEDTRYFIRPFVEIFRVQLLEDAASWLEQGAWDADHLRGHPCRPLGFTSPVSPMDPHFGRSWSNLHTYIQIWKGKERTEINERFDARYWHKKRDRVGEGWFHLVSYEVRGWGVVDW